MFFNPETLCIQKYQTNYILTLDGSEICTPAGMVLEHNSRRFIRYMRTSLEASPVLNAKVLTPFSLFCTQKDFVEEGCDILERNLFDALSEDILLQRDSGPEMVGQVDAWLPIVEYFEDIGLKLPQSKKDISEDFLDYVRWQYSMLRPSQRSGLLSLRNIHHAGVILPLLLILKECSSCEYTEALLAAKSVHPRIYSLGWDEHIENYYNLKEDANIVLEYISHYDREPEIELQPSPWLQESLCA